MTCVICNKELPNGKSMFSNAPLCSSECFGIHFWNEIVLEKDKHIFINGNSYVVGNESAPGAFRGFGGRAFYIEALDGSGVVIRTTNLWMQGTIPATHRDVLRDTHRFVQPSTMSTKTTHKGE